jgi:hypothetical protein
MEEPNVRFGSKADMCAAKPHVRFTPNSDRESGHPQTALGQKRTSVIAASALLCDVPD